MAEDFKKGKDGYYRTSMSVPDGQGNSRRIYLRAKSKPELREMVTRKKIEIERGELCFNGKTKFRQWAEEWLQVYKLGVVGERTYFTYKTNVEKHINPVIGNISLCDIRPVHCQKMLNQHAGESKSHVSKLRYTLSQIFEQAIDNEYITKNPARRLSLPDTTEGSHRPLTDYERQKILALCETHRAGLWVLIMLYCGLRPSEAIALNWGDIDFNGCFISVSHTLHDDRRTKTAAGVRRVPAPPELIEKLRDAKRRSRTTFVFGQMLDPAKPHTKQSMNAMWRNFKRELDISMGAKVYRNEIVLSVIAEDLSPYCLRHTCATDYQAAGIPLNVAKVLLGHKDIKVTANIYTHYTGSDEANASSQLNSFWRSESVDTSSTGSYNEGMGSASDVPKVCQILRITPESLDNQGVA